MTFLAYLEADPWAGVPRSLWPNNDLDPNQLALRERLCGQAVKEKKIERAIHDGRIYHLTRDLYLHIRQQKLERIVSAAQGDKPY